MDLQLLGKGQLMDTGVPRGADSVPWASAAAQGRLRGLETEHTERGTAAVRAAVREALAEHHRRLDVDGIPLYAGTNVLSPHVTAAHDPALTTRLALGWPGEKVQSAAQELEHLEVVATRQVARSLRAAYAEVRFVTASMANLAVYTAFTEPGDTIAVLSPEAGGHTSHQGVDGTAGVRGLRVVHLPYSPERLDVDGTALAAFVRAERPRLLLVGGSVALFPHDLGRIRAAAGDALLVYDASHTAGLMAAGLFQDPLAIAAAEAVEQSPAWAKPTAAFAAELAARLAATGLPVLGADRGHTRTHQVVVDVTAFGGGPAVVRRLEGDGLYAGPCRLPWQDPGGPAAGSCQGR
ncbi:glycine hydroxymethyltransferase, partial [Crossiella equi]|uniref:glycine hydroxymethyltransferase n=1 Tax=Crossiella equi TaxID=130796 RepID=UPI001B7FF9C7